MSNSKSNTNQTFLSQFQMVNSDTQYDLNKVCVYRADVPGCPPYFGVTSNMKGRIHTHRDTLFNKNLPNRHYPKEVAWKKAGVRSKMDFDTMVKFTVIYEVDDRMTAKSIETALINSTKCLNDMQNDNKRRAERNVLYPRNTIQKWVNSETGEVLVAKAVEIAKRTGISRGNLSNIRHGRKSPINHWHFEGVVGTV